MEKEFVTYRLAFKFKELGFDEPCFGWFTEDNHFYLNNIKNGKIFKSNDGCLAPTFSQAFRWFRENYQWTIKVNQVTKNNWSYTLENFPKDRTYYGEIYKTFEVAEIACLEKLIEFIEREK